MNITVDSVGDIPVVNHEPEATVAVDTGVLDTVSNGTVHSTVPKVTCADVARKRPPPAAAVCGRDLSNSRGQDTPRRNKLVLRSLSRNNPVIKVKA